MLAPCDYFDPAIWVSNALECSSPCCMQMVFSRPASYTPGHRNLTLLLSIGPEFRLQV